MCSFLCLFIDLFDKCYLHYSSIVLFDLFDLFDTSVVDTPVVVVDTPDAAVVDTSVMDASVVDTSMVDVSVDDAPVVDAFDLHEKALLFFFFCF